MLEKLTISNDKKHVGSCTTFRSLKKAVIKDRELVNANLEDCISKFIKNNNHGIKLELLNNFRFRNEEQYKESKLTMRNYSS